MNRHLIIIVLFFMATACNNKREANPEQWTEEELTTWYNENEWNHGFQASPDETINQRELAIRYYRNPDRWEKAFSFLAGEDLQNLENGRYEIDGSDLFVMVDEYVPKDIEDAQYEAHRIYADIQFVAAGEEQISIVPIDQSVITTPYEEEKDIIFLASTEENNRIATPDNFFIFFPGDVHRPSVKTNDSTLVKKIVVKVRLD